MQKLVNKSNVNEMWTYNLISPNFVLFVRKFVLSLSSL